VPHSRIVFLLVLSASPVFAQSQAAEDQATEASSSATEATGSATEDVEPIALVTANSAGNQSFQWKTAIDQAFLATAIPHVVRVTSESDTQSELGGPFWKDYFHSLENFHGYNDGDAFYTTYFLHPMEGSLAGYIEQQNDPAYRNVQFGMSQRYWVSRMRALAFAAAYSVQWTAGPISEASIGNVQHYAPPGLDDIIVTPLLGMVWMVGEDAMDRYILRWIEARSHNYLLIALARSTMTPTRAYANVLRFKKPWFRDNRPLYLHPAQAAGKPELFASANGRPVSPEPRFNPTVWPKSVAFELEADAVYERFLGATGSNCVGGEGRGAIKISTNAAVIMNVGGCELMGFDAPNVSGDTLWYMAGSRYAHPVGSDARLQSYVEGLAGGMKIVHDHINEELKTELTTEAEKKNGPPPPTPDYTTEYDTNALSLKMGMGLTYNLSPGAVIRLCAIDYQHSWNRRLEGLDYQNGIQVSVGMSFRLGRWGQ
jgi:hypothetical protein